MRDAEILGRVYLQTEYERSQAILAKFRRMAKDPKYVEHLYNDVQTYYADESPEERRDTFIGLTYRIYQPLSFLQRKEDGKAAGKLPPGVRDEMARCLGFVSSEMINHHKAFIEPALKPYNNGIERPLMTKVMVLVDRFRPLSINASDSQFKLEL
jgi:hypothetical protein